MSALEQLRVPYPTPRPSPGTCRVCGCTNHMACELKHTQIHAGGKLRGTYATAVCQWVERDLCSRCHGPNHPTRRQAGEIARIEARHGPLQVARLNKRGDLQLMLLARIEDDDGCQPQLYTLTPSGRLLEPMRVRPATSSAPPVDRYRHLRRAMAQR